MNLLSNVQLNCLLSIFKLSVFLFLSLYINWRLNGSVRKQLNAIIYGFNEIIPKEKLNAFDENELEVNNLIHDQKNLHFNDQLNVYSLL